MSLQKLDDFEFIHFCTSSELNLSLNELRIKSFYIVELYIQKFGYTVQDFFKENPEEYGRFTYRYSEEQFKCLVNQKNQIYIIGFQNIFNKVYFLFYSDRKYCDKLISMSEVKKLHQK